MRFADHADASIRKAGSWITSQRWYGDKARSHGSLTPESIVPVGVDDLDSALVIVRFSYDQGPDSRYFVPLVASGITTVQNGRPELRDALADPEFLNWFIDGFAAERTIPGDVIWSWRRLGNDFPDTGTVNFTNARMIAAEQSNTSVVFDDRFIGKIYRRLQPGINPDLEIGEFLSAAARFPHAPKLYGLVEIERDGEVTAIAAIQQFVRNQGDGWSWLLRALEQLSAATSPVLVASIALLGQRTAEMHVALTSDLENEAFAPEPFAEQDADDLIKRVIAEMEESVEGLARRLTPAEVEQLHKGLGGLMSGAWSLVGAARTRVHGDYHLGQTLRTVDDDFCLIDFEGEPSRPMEQRRMKQSPLKDVAGMLRSLDYAAATAMAASTDLAQKQAIIDWLPQAVEAFEASYREIVNQAPVRIIPLETEAYRAGLNLLIAEKALYEIRYELNNRPDWLSIPLNGIRRLAGIAIPDEG